MEVVNRSYMHILKFSRAPFLVRDGTISMDDWVDIYTSSLTILRDQAVGGTKEIIVSLENFGINKALTVLSNNVVLLFSLSTGTVISSKVELMTASNG
jgi:hypothetical protein